MFPVDRSPDTIHRHWFRVDDAGGEGKISGNSSRGHIGSVAHVVRAAQCQKVATCLGCRIHMIQKWIHSLDGVHSVRGRPTIKDLQTGSGCFTRKRDSGFELNHHDMGNDLRDALSQYPSGGERAEQGSALMSVERMIDRFS